MDIMARTGLKKYYRNKSVEYIRNLAFKLLAVGVLLPLVTFQLAKLTVDAHNMRIVFALKGLEYHPMLSEYQLVLYDGGGRIAIPFNYIVILSILILAFSAFLFYRLYQVNLEKSSLSKTAIGESHGTKDKAINAGNDLITYKVFKHMSGNYIAVKQGWSWPAFFFGLVWVLVKKLWGLSFALVTGLFMLGMFLVAMKNDDAINIITNVVVILIAFALGKYGNSLWEEKLSQEGYELVDTVLAEDQEAAKEIVSRK